MSAEMTRRTGVSLSAALALVCMITPAMAERQSDLPTVPISISVNGGTTVTTEAPLNEISPGVYKITAWLIDPGSTWVTQVNYTADTDVEGNAQLNGFVEFNNKTALTVEVVFHLDLPLCPLAVDAASIGGSTTVKLTMSADGGAVTVPGGDALWTARVNESGKKNLFDAPFELKGTGKGTATTSYSFGDPMPGWAINQGAQTFGLRHRFNITGYDKVRLTSMYILGAPTNDIVDCNLEESLPGDLDHNSVVGNEDLGIMLAAWGSDNAEADLNHDGVVGGDDLGLLLTLWTE